MRQPGRCRAPPCTPQPESNFSYRRRPGAETQEFRGQACGEDPKRPACALATTSGAPAQGGAWEPTPAGHPCTEAGLKPQRDPGAVRLRSRTAGSAHSSRSRRRPSLLAAVSTQHPHNIMRTTGPPAAGTDAA